MRSLEADALVNTGAVRSCIPAPLVARLGLMPFDSSLVEYADGRKEPVGLVDGLRFEVMNRRSGDEALILGDETLLLGQTILEKMDLMVECAHGRLVKEPRPSGRGGEQGQIAPATASRLTLGPPTAIRVVWSRLASELGFLAGTVPNMEDVHTSRLLGNVIKNAV